MKGVHVILCKDYLVAPTIVPLEGLARTFDSSSYDSMYDRINSKPALYEPQKGPSYLAPNHSRALISSYVKLPLVGETKIMGPQLRRNQGPPQFTLRSPK